MARVSVEQKWLSDSRAVALARLAGLANRYESTGRMLPIWNECQERGTYHLTRDQILDIHPDVPGFCAAMIGAGLAREEAAGIYICGTVGRIEWLTRKRQTAHANGRKGGRPRKPDAETDAGTDIGSRTNTETDAGTDVGYTENLRRFPQESSPAPAPAPAQRERELSTTRVRASSPAHETFLRTAVREIRNDAALMEMALHDPDAYEQAVRDRTGCSPDELADIVGDDAIRPHGEVAIQ